MQDRIEAQEVRALRLPPPERTDGERHDVPLAERRIDDLGAAGQRLTADEDTRQQHLAGVRRERQDHPRPGGVVTAAAEATRETTATASAPLSTLTAATTAARPRRCGEAAPRSDVRGRSDPDVAPRHARKGCLILH